MRLINIQSLELREFFDEEIPTLDWCKGYIILSHTWGKEEISFAEWNAIQESPDSEKAKLLREKEGYRKIRAFLSHVQEVSRQKFSSKLEWAWVDTCCIDKSSSAELSEAINSMYTWYAEAASCFAYLSDVPTGDVLSEESTFRRSRWFTRGWTLQELIAPRFIDFFDREWNLVGTKLTLSTLLHEITGVSLDSLRTRGLRGISIAEKMSWAASRQTTRKEDMAYCLLGLFNVNMPLLYGEGSKAFVRLQQEIIKTSPDHTIFAWRRPDDWRARLSQSVFATSPSFFKTSSRFIPEMSLVQPQNRRARVNEAFRPFQTTNFGLQIHLPVITCNEMNLYHGQVVCQVPCRLGVFLCSETSRGDEYAAIWLKKTDASTQRVYGRINAHAIAFVSKSAVSTMRSRPGFYEEIFLRLDEEQISIKF